MQRCVCQERGRRRALSCGWLWALLLIPAVVVAAPATNCTGGLSLQLSEDGSTLQPGQGCEQPGAPGVVNGSEEGTGITLPVREWDCPEGSRQCVEVNSTVSEAELSRISSQLDANNGMGAWGDQHTVSALNAAGVTTHDTNGVALSQIYVVDGRSVCSCPRSTAGGGCFTPETKILMANREERSIDSLRVGDEVWGPEVNGPLRVVRVIEGPELNPLVRIGGEGFAVDVTELHPIVLRRGMVQARSVAEGDEVRLSSGRFAPVRAVSRLPVAPKQRVINLELEGGSHQLVGGGIVTGDNVIQRALAESAK